jgi:hypothetical protein
MYCGRVRKMRISLGPAFFAWWERREGGSGTDMSSRYRTVLSHLYVTVTYLPLFQIRDVFIGTV